MAKKKKTKGGKGYRKEFPEKFDIRAERIFGTSLFREMKKTFVERPTTFRINTLRATHIQVLTTLRESGFKVSRVSWYADAFVLENKSKRELCDLPCYAEGHIYIQSLASMVPPLILDPQAGERVLDLTAAPGSKTSQIAALMGRTGELVANDKNKVRFFKLKHNMELLGVVKPHPNPSLIGEGETADPKEDWRFVLRMEHGVALARDYDAYFDRILLDAPCSAEARFDVSNPRSFGYWSERKIKEMAKTQRTLLRSAWSMLRPGGTLVYSTCTFAPEENEVMIAKFLTHTSDACLRPARIDGLARGPIVTEWGMTTIDPAVREHALRIMPTTCIEGFFVVKIIKTLQSKK